MKIELTHEMTSKSNRTNSTRKAKRLVVSHSHSHSTPTHSSGPNRIVWRDNIETSRDASTIRDGPPAASFPPGERMKVNQVKSSSHNTKRCSPYVNLLLLLAMFQTVIIHKLMTGKTSTQGQSSTSMESIMDSPKEIDRSSLPVKAKNSKDVIIYLAQFSEVHSSYGAQSDAAHNNITGLSKFQRSLDLCTLLICFRIDFSI